MSSRFPFIRQSVVNMKWGRETHLLSPRQPWEQARGSDSPGAGGFISDAGEIKMQFQLAAFYFRGWWGRQLWERLQVGVEQDLSSSTTSEK